MTETIAILGVGPSFGLGAALGRRFARGGFRVFVGGRNTARLAKVAVSLSQGSIKFVAVDARAHYCFARCC